MRLILAEVAPFQKNLALISVQLKIQSALCQLARSVEILHSAHRVPAGNEHRGFAIQSKALSQRALPQMFAAAGRFLSEGTGNPHPAACTRITIVEYHQGP